MADTAFDRISRWRITSSSSKLGGVEGSCSEAKSRQLWRELEKFWINAYGIKQGGKLKTLMIAELAGWCLPEQSPAEASEVRGPSLTSKEVLHSMAARNERSPCGQPGVTLTYICSTRLSRIKSSFFSLAFLFSPIAFALSSSCIASSILTSRRATSGNGSATSGSYQKRMKGNHSVKKHQNTHIRCICR